MKLLFLLLLLPFISISQENEKVYDFVEVEPQFPGGPDAMAAYIVENIEYPKEAMDNKEQGIVYVKFIVGSTGVIREVGIRKGVSPSLDAEAMRVVSGMPNWIPGKQQGKAVNVSYTLPINYMLDTSNSGQNLSKKEKRKLKKSNKKSTSR